MYSGLQNSLDTMKLAEFVELSKLRIVTVHMGVWVTGLPSNYIINHYYSYYYYSYYYLVYLIISLIILLLRKPGDEVMSPSFDSLE